MERLREQQDTGAAWSLQCDKDLLTTLQDLSGDLMSSIRRIDTGLCDLESNVARLSDQFGLANLRYEEICEQRYVEQAVQAPRPEGSGEARPLRLQKQQTIDSDNFAEIVHPKYREALSLCSEAFRRPSGRLKSDKIGPMPFIFGSPEYLQDASFGIRELSANDQAEALQEADLDDRPADAAFNGAEDDENEAAAAADIPDLRAMLEAALRGDLDESALSMMEDMDSGPQSGQEFVSSQGGISATRAAAKISDDLRAASEGEDWKDVDGSEASDSDEALKELLSGGDELFSEEELEGQ